jgi:hypothetical protein
MQKAQFNLGHDEPNKSTTYENTIVNSTKIAEQQPVERVDNHKNSLEGRKTKILMGTDHQPQESEAKTAF